MGISHDPSPQQLKHVYQHYQVMLNLGIISAWIPFLLVCLAVESQTQVDKNFSFLFFFFHILGEHFEEKTLSLYTVELTNGNSGNMFI